MQNVSNNSIRFTVNSIKIIINSPMSSSDFVISIFRCSIKWPTMRVASDVRNTYGDGNATEHAIGGTNYLVQLLYVLLVTK